MGSIIDKANPMGGTGKGLLANSFKQMRDVTKIDGKKFDPGDKFKYQDIKDSTQVVWLDDIKPDLGFETFNSCLTDGWSIEKKHKDQFYIKPEDSPKMFICSNSILKGGGTTNERRKHIIEFSNHYSKQIKKGIKEPIKEEHGCIFFDKEDWNTQEWNKFFSYMLNCVLFYMVNGLLTYKHKGLSKNLLIQSTSEEFSEWVEEKDFKEGIEFDTTEQFTQFRDTYYGSTSDFKQRGFTNWLKVFANGRNWKLKIRSSNHISKFQFQPLSL